MPSASPCRSRNGGVLPDMRARGMPGEEDGARAPVPIDEIFERPANGFGRIRHEGGKRDIRIEPGVRNNDGDTLARQRFADKSVLAALPAFPAAPVEENHDWSGRLVFRGSVNVELLARQRAIGDALLMIVVPVWNKRVQNVERRTAGQQPRKDRRHRPGASAETNKRSQCVHVRSTCFVSSGYNGWYTQDRRWTVFVGIKTDPIPSATRR